MKNQPVNRHVRLTPNWPAYSTTHDILTAYEIEGEASAIALNQQISSVSSSLWIMVCFALVLQYPMLTLHSRINMKIVS